MITNPLPKNGLFATLNANEIAGIIAGMPEEQRHNAYMIYFGTVNMCSEAIDSTIEVTRKAAVRESIKKRKESLK